MRRAPREKEKTEIWFKSSLKATKGKRILTLCVCQIVGNKGKYVSMIIFFFKTRQHIDEPQIR